MYLSCNGRGLRGLSEGRRWKKRREKWSYIPAAPLFLCAFTPIECLFAFIFPRVGLASKAKLSSYSTLSNASNRPECARKDG